MNKLYSLTKEGIAELTAEASGLIAQRSDITQRIKDARELGDLSENAEYTSARQEQDRTESRISEIEHILQNVKVITKPKVAGKVSLGSKVTLKGSSDNGGKTKQFQVVGTVEADPMNGKISDESPIGLALMGKKAGDSVEIKTPVETATYKITDIS
ncbi:MAG: transcription elongation factor GreA [Candidatus Saccharimonadales bacterium]